MRTFVADFGEARSGLLTVGYRFRGGPRVAGAVEVRPGSGVYSIDADPPGSMRGYILWDTGEVSPTWAAADINPAGASTLYRLAMFGAAYEGYLAGYRVDFGPRVATGIEEIAPGIFGGEIAFAPGFSGTLIWDTGDPPAPGDPPLAYAAEAIAIPSGPPATPTTYPDWSDPGLLAGLRHVCRVQVDANAVGTTRDRGSTRPVWVDLAGYEAMRCFVDERAARASDGPPRPDVRGYASMLYATPIVLTIRHRILWTDPTDGTVRTWYPRGKARNESGMNHHMVCELEATDGP